MSVKIDDEFVDRKTMFNKLALDDGDLDRCEEALVNAVVEKFGADTILGAGEDSKSGTEYYVSPISEMMNEHDKNHFRIDRLRLIFMRDVGAEAAKDFLAGIGPASVKSTTGVDVQIPVSIFYDDVEYTA
jgi:hypothetical protein